MLLCSPRSLWREVQDAAGGLPSVPHPVLLQRQDPGKGWGAQKQVKLGFHLQDPRV